MGQAPQGPGWKQTLKAGCPANALLLPWTACCPAGWPACRLPPLCGYSTTKSLCGSSLMACSPAGRLDPACAADVPVAAVQDLRSRRKPYLGGELGLVASNSTVCVTLVFGWISAWYSNAARPVGL